MNNYQHTIPPMTHPLSKEWSQPAISKILITDVRAVMSRQTFDEIPQPSMTIPSGVFSGKMWKREGRDGLWYLKWYEVEPDRIKRRNRMTRYIIRERIIFVTE